MNHMKEVAKMLEVELGEHFKIIDENGLTMDMDFRLTEEGLQYCDEMYGVWLSSARLGNLLSGKCQIKKKPFTPKSMEMYYFIMASGAVDRTKNTLSAFDLMAYALGNCFKTEAEAERKKEKIMKTCYNKYYEDEGIDNL